MCGIVGELRFNGKLSEANWLKLSEMMARRGPDDAGLWADDPACTLAFRRLAILDLSLAGHQPMLSPDGRYVLVFNGEVYNFRDLRQVLARGGVIFRSSGDTEVVLHALIQWGIDALDRLNGMFALAFYDSAARRLLLARDHVGIKPLYVMLTGQGLVFASQYDQILAHPWSRPLSLSPESLTLYLRQGYIQAPHALLSGTHMLEPGTWLEAGADGHIRQGRFFTLPPYRKPDLRGGEAYEAVDAAISAAVKRQLVSDVPLGAFLSGGVDSPLIAAKMRAVNNGTVRAFTISTGGDSLDESSDAAAYARELGLEYTIEQVTPKQALDMLNAITDACGEPFGDYSIFPTMLISRLARREMKVMLSGDGGDELFWGYPERFGSVIRCAQDFRQPYWLRSARWGLKKVLNIGEGYPNLRWRTIGDWYRAKHSHLPEGWLRRAFPAIASWDRHLDSFEYRGWEPDRTAHWLRWNEITAHLTRVLLKVDRASMYHSLEVRVPLLDREVIDVAMRVAWDSCLDLDSGIGKLPLRYALAQHSRHQTLVKRGFAVPMGAWLRGPLRPVFEEAVLARDDLLGIPAERRALKEMFDQHLSGAVDYGWGLWIVLSLALWEERHFRRRAA